MRTATRAGQRSALTLATLILVAACSTGESAAFTPEHAWLGDGSAPIAISHEGVAHSSGRITQQGFIEAREIGFTYMETDIRRLADDTLVAYHDIDGNVENQTLDQLNAVGDDAFDAEDPDFDTKVDGSDAETKLLPPVPEVEALLAAPELADVRWNFELKGGDQKTAALLGAAMITAGATERVCVSFGVAVRVQSMRDALPEGTCMCATILERAFDWDALAGSLDRVGIDERVVCSQMASEPFRGSTLLQVDRRDVRRAHDRFLAIHVYDVLGLETSRADIERWLDMGVDGIITDDHHVLAEVFRERGIWPSD
ncbi:MAG: glycerophosphodiester phosphodiesterase family protein [Ilumatobacter sp.]